MILLFTLDYHCPFAEEYSSLCLFAAAAVFTSLTLRAAKSYIPFGRIKRQPQARWSAEVKEAVEERRKVFAAAYRNEQNHQAYTVFRHASSVIAKDKAGATCSSLSPKYNPKSVYSFLRFVAGSSPSSSSSPNFLNCSSPRSQIRFSPIAGDRTFPSSSQKPCVAEPEATYPSSAEPKVLRSRIPFSALPSLMKFLRGPQTSLHPPPLAQTKSSIPC